MPCDTTEVWSRSWRCPDDRGNSVIDRSTEPPFSDRRQGEPDASWGDRPGIMASLLRYRVIVVAATVLGAVAGYGIAQLLPVRYQAEAVLILSDPGGPGVLGGGDALAQRRPKGLPGQAVGHHDLQRCARACRCSSLGASSRSATSGTSSTCSPRRTWRASRSPRPAADPQVGGRARERGRHRLRAGHAANARPQDAQRRSPASRSSAPATRPSSTPAPGPRTASSTRAQQQLGQPDHRPPAARAGHHHPGGSVYAVRGGVLRAGRATHLPVAAQAQAGRGAGRAAGSARGRGLGMVGGSARPARRGPARDPARILEAPLLGEVPRLPRRTRARWYGRHALDPALEDAFHLIVASMDHELTGVGGKSVAVTSVGPDDEQHLDHVGDRERRLAGRPGDPADRRRRANRGPPLRTRWRRPHRVAPPGAPAPRGRRHQGVPRPARVDDRGTVLPVAPGAG